MAAEVIVVGAGAAGLLAAGFASRRGLQVKVLEKTERTGLKVRISGKGRCNLTNARPLEELPAFYGANGRFLYSSLHRFSNYDVMDFFRSLGVGLKVEEGQRVFPRSDRADDVADALEAFARSGGARFLFGRRVTELVVEDGAVRGVACMGPSGREKYHGEAVLIATGGMSYPGTGSTGDGYALAQQAGHRIVPPRPALVPLRVVEEWPRRLAGLALQDVELRFWHRAQSVSQRGEMMFAHFGLTGPAVLTASDRVSQWFQAGAVAVQGALDLAPALTENQLEGVLVAEFTQLSRRQLKNSLDKLLPKRLIPVIIELSGISPEKPVNQLSREERLRLRCLLKRVPLTVSGTLPISAAIVTAGGVDVREVNPRTMESRLVKGLYFAGEVLDVHGLTGGFNLQAAFSTAYTAANAF